MTDLRILLLVVALAAPGCFGDPPSTGGDTDEPEADSSGAPASTGMSTTGEPGTTVGTLEGSGESSGEPPCDPETTECVEPGETMWSVEFGDAGNDGAYTVVVSGDTVVVGGELASGGGTRPWMFRLGLDDGGELWSLTSEAGEGTSVLRRIVDVGDDTFAGVGSVDATPSASMAWLEARDSAGSQLAGYPYNGTTKNHLFGATLTDGYLWAVGYASENPDPELPFPLLQSYTTQGAGAWNLDYDSLGNGQLAELEGALFDVAFMPSGDLLAVGYAAGDGKDAAIMLFTAGGEYLETPVTLGDGFDDGFVGVDIDENGNGIAVGGDGTGPTTSQILIVPFEVGDSIVIGTPRTWGDAAFTSANGFARDGDALFIAVGTSDDPALADPSFDSAIVRFDGEATEPTWVVPYADDSPGRDFASDVALAPGDTIVVCGVFTPEDSENGNAWVRRLGR